MIEGRVEALNVKPNVPGERGLPKKPVRSVKVSERGLAGDFNRYRHEVKNDSPDMAVLIMPLETIREIQDDGWPVAAGHIGENITTSGIRYADLSAGIQLRIGEALVEVTEPCEPCTNLSHLPYVGRYRAAEFVKSMVGRRGWYARVIRSGLLKVGDTITAPSADDRK